MPAAIDDPILRELARWLGGIPADAGERVAGWTAATWERFPRLVLMHGLAAFLAEAVRAQPAEGATPLASVMPASTPAWLEEQEERIGRRADRMQAELAAILARAAERGIEVMPLKGSMLAAVPAVDARRRPMADLDLLVRPHARGEMGAVLEELGYARRRRPEIGPKPLTYKDPGGGVVVDRAGEHEDNPRPVEVHIAVQRHLWEWVEDDVLTAALWASASRGSVVGQPAMVPAIEVVFEHLAVHATTGLMRGRGRLIQWLDLARLAGAGFAPSTWVAPRLAYPSLALAARALPQLGTALDLDLLAGSCPPVVVRWARTAPLDGHAGLETGGPRVPPRGVGGQVGRWHPSGLRLAVAYGPAPAPVQLGRLGLAIARYGALFGWGWTRRQGRRQVRRASRLPRRVSRRVLRLLGRGPGPRPGG